MTDDSELHKKLDALIDILTPKPADPKQDAIDKAAELIRKSLTGKFPQEKLDTWDLDHLTIAQEVIDAKPLPDPIGNEDTKEEKEEEKPAPKLDSAEDLFKHSATWYDKEVPI